MAITPVPKGHLIKKNGNSLKNGGKVDAFSKMKKSMKTKKKKFWMDEVKKDISKVRPFKKKK